MPFNPFQNTLMGPPQAFSISPPMNRANPATMGSRFQQFLASPAALAMAAGLVGGRTPREQMGGALGKAAQAMADQQDFNREQAVHNATAAWLDKMGRSDLANMARAGAGQAAMQIYAAEQRQKKTGDGGVYGSPIYMQKGDDLAIGAIDKGGEGVRLLPTPEGYKILEPTRTLDLGTSRETIGGRSGATLRSDTVDLRGAESEKKIGALSGEAAAQAQLDLPSVIATADDSIALIDSVIDDPALSGITGKYLGQERYPDILYSQEGIDLLAKVKQLQGKAFLQAFETLKGGGVISDREGAAATDAMARLQRSQSTEAYKEALAELRSILVKGRNRAISAAGGQSNQPQFSAPPQSPAPVKKQSTRPDGTVVIQVD